MLRFATKLFVLSACCAYNFFVLQLHFFILSPLAPPHKTPFGMAGVEHVPGTRLLAVARRWDKCTVAVYVHRCSDDAARHLRAVVGQVVKSAATVVQTHPRLTITDQKAGTIHYETDEHAIYVLVTEPS